MKDEISPLPAMARANCVDLRLTFPFFVDRDSRMTFRAGTPVDPGPWGILQPAARRRDRRRPTSSSCRSSRSIGAGNRIGMGKGHYDRALPGLRDAGARLIGCGWGFQRIDDDIRARRVGRPARRLCFPRRTGDVSMIEPSWRKPVGVFGILAWITLWVVLVASLSGSVGDWPVLVQALFYLVAGIAWIVPLKPRAALDRNRAIQVADTARFGAVRLNFWRFIAYSTALHAHQPAPSAPVALARASARDRAARAARLRRRAGDRRGQRRHADASSSAPKASLRGRAACRPRRARPSCATSRPQDAVALNALIPLTKLPTTAARALLDGQGEHGDEEPGARMPDQRDLLRSRAAKATPASARWRRSSSTASATRPIRRACAAWCSRARPAPPAASSPSPATGRWRARRWPREWHRARKVAWAALNGAVYAAGRPRDPLSRQLRAALLGLEPGQDAHRRRRTSSIAGRAAGAAPRRSTSAMPRAKPMPARCARRRSASSMSCPRRWSRPAKPRRPKRSTRSTASRSSRDRRARRDPLQPGGARSGREGQGRDALCRARRGVGQSAPRARRHGARQAPTPSRSARRPNADGQARRPPAK